MNISQKGLQLIMNFESCRLQAYQDSAGNWTIGYGHKGGVKPGQTITQAQAVQYLRSDVGKVENAINLKRYDLTQNQFDALVSFFYNLGTTAIKKYGFHDLIKADSWNDEITNKMERYVYAGGRVAPGLITRREAEVNLYNA